ncbi:unnamed protein product [Rangifer tarandus platyrhynchus]|uniref:Uncharacterized protein n=2 Tax=Rangifer tarandus platyrhynchus TaxID=3082113 RepID=A0ABN8YL65_RANTA|nr:unnamed protein product [Rangifer tarandus platyrhynchus]
MLASGLNPHWPPSCLQRVQSGLPVLTSLSLWPRRVCRVSRSKSHTDNWDLCQYMHPEFCGCELWKYCLETEALRKKEFASKAESLVPHKILGCLLKKSLSGRNVCYQKLYKK